VTVDAKAAASLYERRGKAWRAVERAAKTDHERRTAAANAFMWEDMAKELRK
jgi:hypothetical protein